jgi:hypothetical protein
MAQSGWFEPPGTEVVCDFEDEFIELDAIVIHRGEDGGSIGVIVS